MVKTIGSTDIRKRKGRSDKGKRRKKYRGKPVKKKRKKHGRYVPYISKRDRQSEVKLWFFDVTPMSKDGYRRFPKKIRSYIKRTVYGRKRVRIDALPEDISTKEKVAEFVINEVKLWDGVWLMKMFSHAKNKYHTTARAVAIIKITDHPEGLRAVVTPSYKGRGLYRYWFWKGGS